MRTFILFLLCVFSFFSFEAQGQVKHNAAVQLTRTSFNTSSDDYPNAMTKSGGRLYVTSERSGKQKIYFVDGNGAEWSSMKEIDGAINDAKHSGSATLTADGQYVIFAAYSHEVEGSGRTDLYSARKEGGEWRDVQNLGPIVNSNTWDAAPSLTQDGTVLYFSSDRTGGKGGTDIYLTKRTREGWTKPQNMNEINTASDETTPYIAADGKTFYFASNRSGGAGGFDIYVSRKSGDSFSSPTNIGTPINSEFDDIAYIAKINTDHAYFASTRSGGAGGLDVYFAVPNPEMPSPVTIVRGIVSDKVTSKPLGATPGGRATSSRTRWCSALKRPCSQARPPPRSARSSGVQPARGSRTSSARRNASTSLSSVLSRFGFGDRAAPLTISSYLRLSRGTVSGPLCPHSIMLRATRALRPCIVPPSAPRHRPSTGIRCSDSSTSFKRP
jgi:Tol biopolymer transport system component